MNWKLTQKVPGEPEIDQWGQDEPQGGPSLLRLLAADPANGLEQVADGVYYEAKRSTVTDVAN